jgi:hypothetical protein
LPNTTDKGYESRGDGSQNQGTRNKEQSFLCGAVAFETNLPRKLKEINKVIKGKRKKNEICGLGLDDVFLIVTKKLCHRSLVPQICTTDEQRAHI